jgi:hypothetical protein
VSYDNVAQVAQFEKRVEASSPVFITEEQMAKAAEEWKRILSMGLAADYLPEEVLAWAKEHPDDPRVPEALHFAWRVDCYGCADNREKDASVLHGPSARSTIDRRTLSCFPAKSTSPPPYTEQFAHAKSGARSQEDERPLSVTQTGNETVDFGRQKHFWYCALLCALADGGDAIVVDKVVSSGVVIEYAHQIRILV